MGYLQLPSHVSYGLVAERAVFLDLRRDRYVALPLPAEQAFRHLRALEEPMLPAGPERDVLLGTGLVREGSLRGRLAAAAAPAPSASLFDETARPRAGPAAWLRARGAVSRARRRLAERTLFEIVDAIRESRFGASSPGDTATAEAAARVFLAARAMVPTERRCLLDCLALLDWLGDEARHATLVFGVRLDPFAAHCWLQTDRLLLTDATDTAGMFVPVLAV